MTSALPSARPSSELLVERAGTCLDGDNCQRWHCWACGLFWLGSAVHACGAPARDVEHMICVWMEEELQASGDLAMCTKNVLRRVKDNGLSEALLEWAIGALWRDHHGDDDEDQGNGNSVVKTSAARNHQITASELGHQPRAEEDQVAIAVNNDVAAKHERPHVSPGPRRVNGELLATQDALFECLYQVDGRWLRLGDLDRAQCNALEREYEAAAGEARARARLFKQLAAKLREGETVRRRWTTQQLLELIGDTLGGAASARPIQK